MKDGHQPMVGIHRSRRARQIRADHKQGGFEQGDNLR